MKPNLLVLMADQLMAEPVHPRSLCRTPHLDRLIERGVRFNRAYTPNPVCSPARASLMTGQLPHNHGVLWVTHTMDKDQGVLREDRIHWAQRLNEAGYATGYFGKWHVTHGEDPAPYGWDVDGSSHSERFRTLVKNGRDYLEERRTYTQKGYREALFSGITSLEPEERPMGVAATLALEFLQGQKGDAPWCCMVSVPEPHDPFVCGRKAYGEYEGMNIPLRENWSDPMEDKPGVYRRSAGVNRDLTTSDWQEAVRRYYASVTEIDGQFGRVLDFLDETGQRDNTLIVLLSDHGDFMGAHGLYCKNIGVFEEALNIPLVFSGPGVKEGAETSARVGTQDIHPTLLAYFGLASDPVPDSRSFLDVLKAPEDNEDRFREGFSENFGGRYLTTQRVFYRDNWKYVLNGFDYDELYDLEKDPGEMTNLAALPGYAGKMEEMARGAWAWMEKTGDHTLVNTHYPPFRFIAPGPLG